MNEEKRRQARHSIGVVSRRTGLKPDVIRAWERRYGAIEPSRTETNRRFYTDEQVERLVLLRTATLSGRQIGQVCHLSADELRELVVADQEAISRAPRVAGPRETDSTTSVFFDACLAAVEDLDAYALQFQLERAVVELSHPRLIDLVIVPLLSRIGELWEKGSLRIAHEHLACIVIRAFLNNIQSGYVPPENAPDIVVATPAHQFHEMGALLVAATAAAEGWRVVCLGADLPAEEIVAAMRQKAAKVIALSVVFPTDDPHLHSELQKIRRLAGPSTAILVGGSAADIYTRTLKKNGMELFDSLAAFRMALRELRRQAAAVS